MKIAKKPHICKPKWLSRKLPTGPAYQEVRKVIAKNRLNTVCQEANCPNQFECYSQGSATFMILGDRCTRNCRFCNVQHGSHLEIDMHEPERVAKAVKDMGLRYVVITSVTRDDLSDGGSTVFAETIRAIRAASPDTLVEVLIPDFLGEKDALQTVVEAGPDVLNHNMETVSRLYSDVRPEADYQRSLDLLAQVKEISPDMIVKTGLMVGLGETDEELLTCFSDIKQTGCDILIVGQYLQPSLEHADVKRYVSPEQFDILEKEARSIGFQAVVASPLVRSSYRAEELFRIASDLEKRKR